MAYLCTSAYKRERKKVCNLHFFFFNHLYFTFLFLFPTPRDQFPNIFHFLILFWLSLIFVCSTYYISKTMEEHITSKAGGLSGFHLSGIRWVPSTQQIHRKKRKKENKNKKKGTKPKNISWYLFGESRPSVSRIWLTAVIECRESWRRIKAALLQANASRIAWQPTMSLGSRYTQPLGYWVIAHEMKYNKIKATRIDVKLPMTYMHLQNRAMRWMNSTLNLFLCQLKWI